MREPLDDLARPGDGEPDAGGGYDRPNQPWVCGNADAGCPCPFGPTPRGACPDLAECRPVMEGDRWRCNRPERRGGPCAEGPGPDGQCACTHRCTPVRSLRTKRKRFAVGVGVFLAGALAMVLGSQRAADFTAPGALTHAHARLLDVSDANRCQNCHPGGDATLLGHTAAAFVGHEAFAIDGDAKTQSDLCLDCHDKQFDREHALLAHGLPAGSLQSLTTPPSTPPADRDAAPLMTASLGSGLSFGDSHGESLPWGGEAHADPSVACAVCHQEHHGATHNLSAITNHRCQACHAQRYDSFASDHPDFGNWPHRRRTRIVFDHARHEGLHFAKENAEFACSACHVEGQNGSMLTLGYEASCAKCHDPMIERGQVDGVPMLALPTVDRDALASHDEELGPWREGAVGDFDGDLPGPMKLLLAADPAAAEVLNRRGAELSFFDFDPDQSADAADAALLAGATRELVGAIARNGHTEVATRIGGSSKAATGLSSEFVTRVWWHWFGDLTSGPATKRRELVARHAAGGWFADPATLSVRYAATGHADPVLAAWIEAAVALGEDQSDLRLAVLAELERTAGGCTTCHSIERQPGSDTLVINWRAFSGDNRRPFTRFSHLPHLTQPDLSDCRHCHAFTEPTATASRYAGTDPHAFVSHFKPITKAACAGCHTKPLAGDGCTQCHNYHVDPLEPPPSHPPMLALPATEWQPSSTTPPRR